MGEGRNKQAIPSPGECGIIPGISPNKDGKRFDSVVIITIITGVETEEQAIEVAEAMALTIKQSINNFGERYEKQR